ncbi:alpha-D-ribose 1-methylphosphonate 5-phosphate C-P-lyase PhnJ [Arcobacter sp. FWKO B]|uniref:alpha-D-ribose 1-methylphosphonate 5-phosphate C-P-lyase PhnJ n=1 Tax=Arcobacter sp. FWKO B TaxID=2593672 RepID=UPI0018A65789|nr:alpha-D-ribose 1-methylphosphonate 5-phosphate C-P-lyase PhnJ [Arcobacter sp. FWKO B]QOG12346.1 alpha-D-ribose 1-methylphosphonate 5-phosphate C-P-lyase PhnJ [Arcobacter sp. FWKO B]
MRYAFLDEDAKKEIRRAILKAVAIPGYLVSFASREMPIARGWGTGGLQVTLSMIKENDVLKVIDQGCDGSVNAVNMRNFITSVTDNTTTLDTTKATLIQTRHRIPEEELKEGQTLIFQVPMPDILETVEPDTYKAKLMHANADYSKLWVLLYEDTSMFGDSRISNRYPVMVEDRYAMDPSPIPKYDTPKLGNCKALQLFGAGREKKIYAIPPYSKVEPLKFEDKEFRIENFDGMSCERCGNSDVYLDEVYDNEGIKHYFCSDTSYCDKVLEQRTK